VSGARIGIDLGTTNSCAAIHRAGRAEVLAAGSGDRTCPSIVARSEQGEWLVGAAARRQAVTNPDRTVSGVKRLIGRRFESAEVGELARTLPYRVVRGDDGNAWVRIAGQALSPAQLSAHLLRHVKASAEERLERAVDAAVITVPAYFDDAQRRATRDAGELSGLTILGIVNEPTAAAIAYGSQRKLDGATVAVFDLGGGTFDISILRIEDGVYEVLATSGDTFLGGDDFDGAVVSSLIDCVQRDHGVDLTGDATALARLREAAEKAKRELTSMATATLQLPFLATGGSSPIHLECELTRAALERLAAPLLARTDAPCRRALADAGVTADQLDHVLLAGGMTRMPAVHAHVEQLFGTRPARDANPDEIVALGAAIHAAALAGELSDIVLLDVTPHALGVNVESGRMSVVIPRNTTIPTEELRTYKTLVDDQSHVDVEIYQGDAERVRDNRYLGRFRLGGLPARPAGELRVDVGFAIDSDGLLRVAAVEHETHQAASIEIDYATPSSGRTGASPASRRTDAPAPAREPETPPGEAIDDAPRSHTERLAAVAARARSERRRSGAGYGFVSERARQVSSSFRAAKPRSARSNRYRADATPPPRPARDPVRDDYEHALRADPFGRLGLHWTSSPAQLEPALAKLRAAYGPASPAAQSSPELAAKRLALAEEAYEALSSIAGRRRHRAELEVDVKGAAELLDQQARLDLRRQDYREALEKLTAAMDLEPNGARKKMIESIASQLRAGS